MAELVLVTCGTVDEAAGALRLAASAKGLEVTVLDAAAGLPHFDARPPAAHPPAVTAVTTTFTRADAVAFALPAAPGGCPGAVLNLLQLLGGAAYDHEAPRAPLAGRPVVLRVSGAPARVPLALEQLESAVTALGGVPVGSEGVPAGDEEAGDGVASWATRALDLLLHGPGQATMPPPVDLGLGHVHLPLSQAVVDVLRRGAGGVSLYAPRSGLGRLRSAIGRRLGPEGGGHDVCVTLGASGALSASLAAHLRAGDAVLLPDPGFPNYRPMVEARGLRPVRYRLEAARGFLPDLAELAALAPSARAIVWNFPHNPTGAVAPRALVEGLVELAGAHDLLILSDEVYADLVWDGHEHVSPARTGGSDRTVVLGSCSKTFAMAGHRVGWAVAPPHLLEPIARVHWAEHMSPPTLGQQAAVAALDATPSLLPPLRETLLASRAAALSALDGTGLVEVRPSGAFYLWLDIRAARTTATDYAAALIREEGVTVMPGEAFGATGNDRVRVSFAAPPDVVTSGCDRLRAFHVRRAATAREGHRGGT